MREPSSPRENAENYCAEVNPTMGRQNVTDCGRGEGSKATGPPRGGLVNVMTLTLQAVSRVRRAL